MPGPLSRLLDPGDWLAIKPQLDPQTPALHLSHVPSSGEVKLRIRLGLIVLAIVSVVVFFVREDGFALFVACGFGFFGLLNLVYGIVQSRFSMSMTITQSEVAVDSKTLFGARNWREPLRSYRGVLLRESQMRESSVGNTTSTRRYYIVELAHDNDARTMPLYVQEGAAPPRDIQETFARRFGLPALSPDGSGETARSVTQLSRRLSDPGARAADPGPAPSGVRLEQRDGAMHITIGQGRLGRSLVRLWWLSLPLIFGGVLYQVDPMMGLVAAGMAGFFVLMILGLGKLMGGKEEADPRAICIDGERIWIHERERGDPALARRAAQAIGRMGGIDLPDAAQTPSPLPRSAVEQIRVDTYTSYTSGSQGQPNDYARLLIEADTGRLEFIGTQFDRKKLEWVRDYLRYRLSTRS